MAKDLVPLPENNSNRPENNNNKKITANPFCKKYWQRRINPRKVDILGSFRKKVERRVCQIRKTTIMITIVNMLIYTKGQEKNDKETINMVLGIIGMIVGVVATIAVKVTIKIFGEMIKEQVMDSIFN